MEGNIRAKEINVQESPSYFRKLEKERERGRIK